MTVDLHSQSLVIAGYPEIYHIGSRLYDAANQLGIKAILCNANQAYKGPKVIQRINWRLRNRRPTYLDTFSNQVVETCSDFKPSALLVTGITPPNAHALQQIRAMGLISISYLTDDPWNKTHVARWFFQALPHYSVVFTPRRANLDQLREIAQHVEYLPFAFDPQIHYLEAAPSENRSALECDVLFYGGADKDRIPYIQALIEAGIRVHLYGGYWGRFEKLRPAWKGMADAQQLRWAVASAKVVLCLVRQANRDGHVMRSFEAPAMGACMIVEDTEEHREIFGVEGSSVLYFQTKEELIDKTCHLLNREPIRQMLLKNANRLITTQPNTYRDRLSTMMEVSMKLYP